MENVVIIIVNEETDVLYSKKWDSFCVRETEGGLFVNDGKVSSASFWSVEKARNNSFEPVVLALVNDTAFPITTSVNTDFKTIKELISIYRNAKNN
jgi:hypothetical protein